MKPIVFDLFCGLFGWGSAFSEQGYRVIGFDVEDQCNNFGKQKPEDCELVIANVRKISGAELVNQYGVPTCIVASPPCQEFSYMAMPWSKAKEKERKILSDPKEKERLTELFNECFRIQREVSEAAGRYVPIVIENVKGAQKWVGKSRWNFGSFHLWGDVPALMPIPAKLKLKTQGPVTRAQVENHNCHINEMRDALKGEGHKTAGMNWSDQTKRGQDFTRIAGKQAMERGVKDFTPSGEPLGENKGPRLHGSKSKARKRASAEIAKIPKPLAEWIAKVFKPS